MRPETLTIERIAIRLAVEGVPVRAMARVTSLPGEIIWEILREAKDRGEIACLPASDWPPGSSRDARLPSVGIPDVQTLALRLGFTFGLTPQHARLVATLMRSGSATTETLHMAAVDSTDPETDPKIVQVVICKLRQRFARFNLAAPFEIKTVWGVGYAMPRTVRDALLAFIEGQPEHPEIQEGAHAGS